MSQTSGKPGKSSKNDIKNPHLILKIVPFTSRNVSLINI